MSDADNGRSSGVSGIGCSLTADRVFGLLADDRRRSVLTVLRRNDDVVRFSDLVAAVANREDGGRPKEIAITLHHNHLPRLADAGVIAYDRRNRAIRYRGDDEVERLLDDHPVPL